MVGTVTLSMEVELAWGSHDKPGADDNLSPDRSAETATLRRLLARCADCEVPFTFSVVGHLFESNCRNHGKTPHPTGWFDADPGTDVETDPLFYAPDLIDEIRTSPVDHEFATHTYSHVLCDEIDDDVLRWELDRALDRHADAGLANPRSFVAPRHRQVDRALLSEYGIETIRTPFDGYGAWPGGPPGTAAWILGRRHPTGTPTEADGVLETRCTTHPSLTAQHLPQGQRPPHIAFRAIPRRVRERIHARYLRDATERAVARDEHVHLWTHLYNLANESQLSVVTDYLEFLADQRDRGRITIETIADLA